MKILSQIPEPEHLIHYAPLSPAYFVNLFLALVQFAWAIVGKGNDKSWLWSVGSSLSSLGNALIGRSRFHTISAYTGYKAHQCRANNKSCQWLRFERWINRIPLFDDNHCYIAAKHEGLL